MSKPLYEITRTVAFDAPPSFKALYPSSLEVLARAFEGGGGLVVPTARHFTIRIGGKVVFPTPKVVESK